jgi:DNA-binding transcriptional MerR regulator
LTRTFAPLPDVALFLGKSERTLRRWVAEGLLPERTASGRRTVCVQDAIRVDSLVRTRSRARPPVI